MDASLFLARVLGLYFLVVGIALLLRPKSLIEMADEFMANRPVMFLSGLLALTVGILIVASHNLWTPDWRIVPTLFGWIAFLKGTAILCLPANWTKIGRFFLRESFLIPAGMAYLLLGAFLAYKGFFG